MDKMDKIENLLKKESEGTPERCPGCFIESHGMIKHKKGCSIGEMKKEDGWSIEIISESEGEEADAASPGKVEIGKEAKGIQDDEFEKFKEGFRMPREPENLEETDKNIKVKETDKNIKVKETDKNIKESWGEIPKIQKKIERVEKSIDIIFGRIQDEINRFEPKKIGSKQKEYLKNQIKIILKESIFKDFKDLKNIQLSEQLSKAGMLKDPSIIISGLKEKILLKYGDSSEIMKIFQNAVNETEIEVQVIFT